MLASKFIVPSFVLMHVLMWGSCSSAEYFDAYNLFPRNNCLLCRIIASFITYMDPQFELVKVFAPTRSVQCHYQFT